MTVRGIIFYLDPGKIGIHKLGVRRITGLVRRLEDGIAILRQLLFNPNGDSPSSMWRKDKTSGGVNEYCSDPIWF